MIALMVCFISFLFSFHFLRREPWELSGRMLYFNCLRLNCVQCLYVYHIIGQVRMQEEVVTISLHHSFTLPSTDPFLFHLLCRKAGISFLQISAFLFLCPAGSVHPAKKKTDAHRVPGGNRSASVCRYELRQIVPFISGFQPFTESFTCFSSGQKQIRKADLRNNAVTTARMTREIVHED